MEAFEHVVKVYLESLGYVVTGGVKFPVRRRIVKKSGKIERQEHGYEVDLVAARHDRLILGSVKSFFGSRGVNRQGFPGIADKSKRTHFKRYTMLNDRVIRNGIFKGAAKLYGYPKSRISMALYVGKFCRTDEDLVRSHLGVPLRSRPSINVVGLSEIVKELQLLADRRTYINDPVVMTLKVLKSAGLLKLQAQPATTSDDEYDDEEDAFDE